MEINTSVLRLPINISYLLVDVNNRKLQRLELLTPRIDGGMISSL